MATHLHLMQRLGMSRALLTSTLCLFMAWCSSTGANLHYFPWNDLLETLPHYRFLWSCSIRFNKEF